jgi:hypothetical protein
VINLGIKQNFLALLAAVVGICPSADAGPFGNRRPSGGSIYSARPAPPQRAPRPQLQTQVATPVTSRAVPGGELKKHESGAWLYYKPNADKQMTPSAVYDAQKGKWQELKADAPVSLAQSPQKNSSGEWQYNSTTFSLDAKGGVSAQNKMETLQNLPQSPNVQVRTEYTPNGFGGARETVNSILDKDGKWQTPQVGAPILTPAQKEMKDGVSLTKMSSVTKSADGVLETRDYTVGVTGKDGRTVSTGSWDPQAQEFKYKAGTSIPLKQEVFNKDGINLLAKSSMEVGESGVTKKTGDLSGVWGTKAGEANGRWHDLGDQKIGQLLKKDKDGNTIAYSVKKGEDGQVRVEDYASKDAKTGKWTVYDEATREKNSQVIAPPASESKPKESLAAQAAKIEAEATRLQKEGEAQLNSMIPRSHPASNASAKIKGVLNGFGTPAAMSAEQFAGRVANNMEGNFHSVPLPGGGRALVPNTEAASQAAVHPMTHFKMTDGNPNMTTVLADVGGKAWSGALNGVSSLFGGGKGLSPQSFTVISPDAQMKDGISQMQNAMSYAGNIIRGFAANSAVQQAGAQAAKFADFVMNGDPRGSFLKFLGLGDSKVAEAQAGKNSLFAQVAQGLRDLKQSADKVGILKATAGIFSGVDMAEKLGLNPVVVFNKDQKLQGLLDKAGIKGVEPKDVSDVVAVKRSDGSTEYFIRHSKETPEEKMYRDLLLSKLEKAGANGKISQEDIDKAREEVEEEKKKDDEEKKKKEAEAQAAKTASETPAATGGEAPAEKTAPAEGQASNGGGTDGQEGPEEKPAAAVTPDLVVPAQGHSDPEKKDE